MSFNYGSYYTLTSKTKDFERAHYCQARERVLVFESLNEIRRNTSRLFVSILFGQCSVLLMVSFLEYYLGSIGLLSLRGSYLLYSSLASVVLTFLPLFVWRVHEDRMISRYLIGFCQVSWSILLIVTLQNPVSGYFHAFCSMVLLSQYRDWKMILISTAPIYIGYVLFASSPLHVSDYQSGDMFWFVLWMSVGNLLLLNVAIRQLEYVKASARSKADREWLARGTRRKVEEEHMLRGELEMALAKAKSSSAAKGSFLANMSHEIRTPLNGIVGALHLLDNYQYSADQKELFGVARKSMQILRSLLDDVLDLSKIEAGKLEFFDEYFDIREFVEELVTIHAASASEKGVVMYCLVYHMVPEKIKADKKRLGQVIANLLANAVKFTHKGTISLKLFCDRMEASDCFLSFEVSDTGIGISSTQQKGLFQTFTQADTGTTKRYGGTGLGLSICKEIVTAMGGEIELDSKEGLGSTFSVHITCPYEQLDLGTNRYFALNNAKMKGLVLGGNPLLNSILVEQFNSWGLVCDCTCELESLNRYIYKGLNEGAPYSALLVFEDLYRENQDKLDPQLATIDIPVALVEGGLGFSSLIGSSDLNNSKFYRWSNFLQQSTLFDHVIEMMAHHRKIKRLPNIISEKQKNKSSHKFTGAKVLLAEDNEINQLIAKAMLEELGVSPIIVENGKLACEELRKGKFDLVFLDYHMPVMDGLEAAKLIRSDIEIYESLKLPLVVLTADTSVGTKERCEESGIDLFLTKPLEPSRLLEVMQKYLGKNLQVEESDMSKRLPLASKIEEKRSDPIDKQALLSRFGGSLEIAEMVLKKYAEQLQSDMPLLREIISNGDAKGLFERAHALKGASSAAGAERVRASALALEELGRSGKVLGGEEILASLEVEGKECLEFIMSSS